LRRGDLDGQVLVVDPDGAHWDRFVVTRANEYDDSGPASVGAEVAIGDSTIIVTIQATRV